MITITEKPIDSKRLKDELSNDKAGAIVIFEGWVRNHNENKSVDALEYSAYQALCYNEAEIIFNEVQSKFDILAVSGIHRVGKLSIGDIAVFVGVTSKHRKAAFMACEYVIDQLKIRLPIWKKEYYTSGENHWVNCQQCSQHQHAPIKG